MKNKPDTEERIVQVALEMFNKTGVEYVGMRELAMALDMRIGNLTYYFPTKDESPLPRFGGRKQQNHNCNGRGNHDRVFWNVAAGISNPSQIPLPYVEFCPPA
jgi:hypothetical protein